jgi:hypothetical protein
VASDAACLPLKGVAMKKRIENHAFSVELKSKEHLKAIALPSNADSSVLIEGVLGGFLGASFVEDSMLEIQGTHGTVRIDMDTKEFRRLIASQTGKRETEK